MRAFWLLVFCVGAVAAQTWIDWLPGPVKRLMYNRPECKRKAFVTGWCRAHFQRYSYNRLTGECEPFIYGGCKGSKNRFETKEICEAMCSSGVPDECLHCRRTKNPAEEVEFCVRTCKNGTAKGKIKTEKNSNFLELK